MIHDRFSNLNFTIRGEFYLHELWLRQPFSYIRSLHWLLYFFFAVRNCDACRSIACHIHIHVYKYWSFLTVECRRIREDGFFFWKASAFQTGLIQDICLLCKILASPQTDFAGHLKMWWYEKLFDYEMASLAYVPIVCYRPYTVQMENVKCFEIAVGIVNGSHRTQVTALVEQVLYLME